eukprot:TRINITY_DN9422_c0_g1_i1.p2 TRINITY_DN9422_c0_g1~~TRINITY_DN9422_c0_g1_i1.p2  ORF type:complete len:934 (+),score=206.39 TRINITY_DN9422_c0_g1_i1:3586-6387(+)
MNLRSQHLRSSSSNYRTFPAGDGADVFDRGVHWRPGLVATPPAAPHEPLHLLRPSSAALSQQSVHPAFSNGHDSDVSTSTQSLLWSERRLINTQPVRSAVAALHPPAAPVTPLAADTAPLSPVPSSPTIVSAQATVDGPMPRLSVPQPSPMHSPYLIRERSSPELRPSASTTLLRRKAPPVQRAPALQPVAASASDEREDSAAVHASSAPVPVSAEILPARVDVSSAAPSSMPGAAQTASNDNAITTSAVASRRILSTPPPVQWSADIEWDAPRTFSAFKVPPAPIRSPVRSPPDDRSLNYPSVTSQSSRYDIAMPPSFPEYPQPQPQHVLSQSPIVDNADASAFEALQQRPQSQHQQPQQVYRPSSPSGRPPRSPILPGRSRYVMKPPAHTMEQPVQQVLFSDDPKMSPPRPANSLLFPPAQPPVERTAMPSAFYRAPLAVDQKQQQQQHPQQQPLAVRAQSSSDGDFGDTQLRLIQARQRAQELQRDIIVMTTDRHTSKLVPQDVLQGVQSAVRNLRLLDMLFGARSLSMNEAQVLETCRRECQQLEESARRLTGFNETTASPPSHSHVKQEVLQSRSGTISGTIASRPQLTAVAVRTEKDTQTDAAATVGVSDIGPVTTTGPSVDAGVPNTGETVFEPVELPSWLSRPVDNGESDRLNAERVMQQERRRTAQLQQQMEAVHLAKHGHPRVSIPSADVENRAFASKLAEPPSTTAMKAAVPARREALRDVSRNVPHPRVVAHSLSAAPTEDIASADPFHDVQSPARPPIRRVLHPFAAHVSDYVARFAVQAIHGNKQALPAVTEVYFQVEVNADGTPHQQPVRRLELWIRVADGTRIYLTTLDVPYDADGHCQFPAVSKSLRCVETPPPKAPKPEQCAKGVQHLRLPGVPATGVGRKRLAKHIRYFIMLRLVEELGMIKRIGLLRQYWTRK